MKDLNIAQLVRLLSFLCSCLPFHALSIPPDEGMWLPVSAEQMNMEKMHAMGLQLSAGEIYSVGQPSIKDAVCLFANNCTGTVISDEGLLITNLHCAGGRIKSLNTDSADYLADGFWAMSRDEEIPCPGLSVTFLISMIDVTDSIQALLNDTMAEFSRNRKIDSLSIALAGRAVRGTPYVAQVKSFFNGNRFYLLLQQTFRDIRLAGSPPAAIGDFGGETDNWSWPRQAADFALFRIYANADNRPADFSPDNIPYKPAWYFPVSLRGIRENDFTMVAGFPGRTNEYATSYAIDFVQNVSDAEKIAINEKKLAAWSEAMALSDSARMAYQSRFDAATSGLKKMKGEVYGLKKAGVKGIKEKYELEFSRRVAADTIWQKQYGSLLPELKAAYDSIRQLQPAVDYYDAVMNSDLLAYVASFQSLATVSSDGSNAEAIRAEAENLQKESQIFFSRYDRTTDLQLLSLMITLWGSRTGFINTPPAAASLMQQNRDGATLTAGLLHASFLDDEKQVYDFLHKYRKSHAKKLVSDPLYRFTLNLLLHRDEKVIPAYELLRTRIATLNRRYMGAQMEVMNERNFYPDANLTFRIAYGTVERLQARDGIIYDYYTTLDGVMEKSKSGSKDYTITPRLQELYEAKNYGPYGDASGKLRTCFLASNHTSGGNSGSPVTDGEGNLTGINFDRAWEATMSDLYYDPDQCRNIAVDIRYVLFMIDVYAGAGYLLHEMTLVQ
ncbi:MAG: S46 family peptidase [Chitinophagales bacterium]|nr:S46 family peptidase [Chitinophagales bacterium]